MDKRLYFAGKIKEGTPRFSRCVKLYGPLPEKEVEAPVEEVKKLKAVKKTQKKKTKE